MALFAALPGVGTAISDLFGSQGNKAEASAYTQAASLATQNAGYAVEATKLQETQAQRAIFQTIGKQQAQVGGAGLASSGSATDLLRSSRQQGALTQQVLQVQGDITENGYKAQAAAYTGQAKAAKAASKGGLFGAVGSLFSDERLKEIVRFVETRPDGVNVYDFCYLGCADVFRGVLAQQVLPIYPEAVTVHETGFYQVDYSKLKAA